MFNGVVSAKMRFFDTNPSGRILNRFSKDIGQVKFSFIHHLCNIFEQTFFLNFKFNLFIWISVEQPMNFYQKHYLIQLKLYLAWLVQYCLQHSLIHTV